MSKIKTRETVKDIKALDKAAIASERMRDAYIRSKDTVSNLMDDGQVSPTSSDSDKALDLNCISYVAAIFALRLSFFDYISCLAFSDSTFL